MRKLIDLHIHTTASDGTLTPAELVEYAISKKLSAVAITDHDTLDGLPEAVRVAKEHDFELVPGVEISVDYPDGEMHILGYFIDVENKELTMALDRVQKFRSERNPKIAQKLRDLDMDITMEEVAATAGGKVVGRPHFAVVMVEKGYVSSAAEAFSNYLAHGQPAYIKKEKLSVEEGIMLIKEAGGIPVLAHPKYLLNDSALKLSCTIKRLKELGLMGIECYYTTHSSEEVELFLNLAKELGLVVTGGTDFHGANKPDIDIGIGNGELRIPYELLAEMKSVSGTKTS